MRKRARFLLKSSSEESFCFPKWKRETETETETETEREFVREKGPFYIWTVVKKGEKACGQMLSPS